MCTRHAFRIAAAITIAVATPLSTSVPASALNYLEWERAPENWKRGYVMDCSTMQQPTIGGCLMHGNKAAPVVCVVFACTGCNAPFEATQIHRPANGSFACGFCGDELFMVRPLRLYGLAVRTKTAEPKSLVVGDVPSRR
jgi:hypothetical protein